MDDCPNMSAMPSMSFAKSSASGSSASSCSWREFWKAEKSSFESSCGGSSSLEIETVLNMDQMGWDV